MTTKCSSRKTLYWRVTFGHLFALISMKRLKYIPSSSANWLVKLIPQVRIPFSRITPFLRKITFKMVLSLEVLETGLIPSCKFTQSKFLEFIQPTKIRFHMYFQHNGKRQEEDSKAFKDHKFQNNYKFASTRLISEATNKVLHHSMRLNSTITKASSILWV